MRKTIKSAFILTAIFSCIVGAPISSAVIYMCSIWEIGSLKDILLLIVSCLVPFLISAAIAVSISLIIYSYITHRMKREYHSVAHPDAIDIEKFSELAPFFEMMNAQQREIEHQLTRVAKEKNRLSTIINNMDEGLIILDNDLRVIMLNESAYWWLGTDTPRSECTGKHVGEICKIEEICGCIERADSVNLTIEGKHLQLHVNHVVSSAEQVGRIGLMLDVTERSEIDRIKQEFTANVSHELKTPLTSISGYAEIIESGMAQGEDTKVFAGRIRKESQRLLALISDIIKLSKLDEASDGENFDVVDILKVANECRDMLEISAKHNDVKVNVCGEESNVLGVSSELTELVYNLIDNGIRYNKKGGEVNVKVTAPAHAPGDAIVILTVSDTGIGIANEHQSRIFERFYRVDKSRSKATGGTGLGLAIVKHVAERHNAEIDIESREDVGTTVRVMFYDMNNDNDR